MRSAIRDKALALGFDAVGFARAELSDDVRQGLRAFLAAGLHGDMGWLAETEARRGDPQTLWSEARTVIALGLNYAPHEDPRVLLDHPDRGLIAVYSRGRDYHDVVKSKLKALARWIVETYGPGNHNRRRAAGGPNTSAAPAAPGVKVFVDTAPVMEKPLAEAAGLGWQGKHTNLVSRAHGSWLFLGEVFTTLEIPPDPPEVDHCGSCRRCQDACPTDAIPQAYRLRVDRCISYLTIEHKGPIPEALRPLMGNRIYGCDDCLAACPWNKFARRTRETAFLPRAELTAPRLADLVQLDDAGFRQVFAGSPIKRIGRDRFVRNVLIALGNTGDAAQGPVIAPLCDDPNPVVADAARWALSRCLLGPEPRPGAGPHPGTGPPPWDRDG